MYSWDDHQGKLQARVSEQFEAVMGKAALELNPSVHLLQSFSLLDEKKMSFHGF